MICNYCVKFHCSHKTSLIDTKFYHYKDPCLLFMGEQNKVGSFQHLLSLDLIYARDRRLVYCKTAQ